MFLFKKDYGRIHGYLVDLGFLVSRSTVQRILLDHGYHSESQMMKKTGTDDNADSPVHALDQNLSKPLKTPHESAKANHTLNASNPFISRDTRDIQDIADIVDKWRRGDLNPRPETFRVRPLRA